MTPHIFSVQPGTWEQGGITILPEGVNFCVFTRFAERVELLLFEEADQALPLITQVMIAIANGIKGIDPSIIPLHPGAVKFWKEQGVLK